MWLFDRKKRQNEAARKEAVIQAIHAETDGKIEEATRATRKVNQFIEKQGGTTNLIFLATGGERRSHGKR